ncbi:hypothetical protein KI387_004009, partial [Taxus chinensis]
MDPNPAGLAEISTRSTKQLGRLGQKDTKGAKKSGRAENQSEAATCLREKGSK